ncbi:MAG: hypothetical protein ISS56_05380 [Anaerolineae bacterium]|nr:hypothetical protein [Anaerolineae bacterium]
MVQEPSVNEAWGTSLEVFYCSNCHSAHLVPNHATLAVCPSCLQAEALPQPERMRREPPELVIPFAVDEGQATNELSKWFKGMWFRPSELRADLLRSRLRRWCLPLWLVDTDVDATWRVEAGYEYQVASFQERYRDGQWASQQVTETQTRWEPRVGRLRRHYDNVAVPALEEHERWMSRLGGYDFRTRKSYSAVAVAGSVVRIPDLEPEAAWGEAEVALDRMASAECKLACQADHVRNWGMHARYDNVRWTQMLVPAYVTYYREGDALHPVWVNGQSGQVCGIKLMSQRKAAIASLVIGALALLCFLFGLLLTALGIGIALILLGALVGIAAPVPATWVWIQNRAARDQ